MELTKKRGRGRPTNAELMASGRLLTVKTCKICQSSVKDAITQDILRGDMTGAEIIKKYAHAFVDAPLSDTNIFSHKNHIDPIKTAKTEATSALSKVSEYGAITKDLYQHRYTKEFNKIQAADALYKQRLSNILQLQHDIERLNETEKERDLNDTELSQRRSQIEDLEFLYRGFNNDLLKHIQLEQDIMANEVNLQFLKELQITYIEFLRKLTDIVVKEILDTSIRDRVMEQVGDALDSTVAPKLNPSGLIDAQFTVEPETKTTT